LQPTIVPFSSSFGGIDKEPLSAHRKDSQDIAPPSPPNRDLAEEIKGMYRLLDLVSESGSNGCGNDHFRGSERATEGLIFYPVDKIIIAQGSLKRFINTICFEAYASVTKVDFHALDEFIIRPVGVYGSKIEIVHLLRSLNAVNDDMCVIFL
jgi:hypothetical protein